jgi:uncharacterized Zn finger protein
VAGYLTANFIHTVGARTRTRGQSYFSAGAVRKLEGDAWSVEARVQGSRLYDVDIFRLENSFEASCSCPYYDGSAEMCKHIWATLLAAEKTGYLKGDDDNVWLTSALYHPNGKQTERQDAPHWRQQLDQLDRYGDFATPRASRARERQWLYLVHVRETLDRQRLTIRVAQRERRKDGTWGVLKQQRLRAQDVDALRRSKRVWVRLDVAV